jgi:hypothetical protein
MLFTCSQACLSLAFIVEGLLFAFHLEGTDLNWKAHLLLVMTIFAAAAVMLAEIGAPGNALLGIARAQLTLLQGVWFMQIAKLLFEGEHIYSRYLKGHMNVRCPSGAGHRVRTADAAVWRLAGQTKACAVLQTA